MACVVAVLRTPYRVWERGCGDAIPLSSCNPGHVSCRCISDLMMCAFEVDRSYMAQTYPDLGNKY